MKTQSPPARSFVSRMVDVLGLDVDLRDQPEPPQAVADATPAWEARANELASCAELMQARGVADHSFGLNFVTPGERVFFVLRGAALVEPKQVAGEWLTRERSVSFRPSRGSGVSETCGPRDWGTVAITNLRVAFQGTTYATHWLFSELSGTMHDYNAPITYFRVGETGAAGVLYPHDATEPFRLRLAVALACADGDARKYAHLLKAELEAHLARRPLVVPTK